MQISRCPSPSSGKAAAGFGINYDEKRNAKAWMSSLLCESFACLLFSSLSCLFLATPHLILLIMRRSMTCFSKGCLPWGQSWGQSGKPWFELTIFIPVLNSFEPTLLKPLAIGRGNGWKCHWRRYVEWRRRGLFISLSCTGSRELLLRQYFNATLAICAGILQIHE